jgi:hypothetical protein
MQMNLTDMIRQLADRPRGVHSSDPALAQWNTTQIGCAAKKLVNRGELHLAKVSHKYVRYFADAAAAEAYVAALHETVRARRTHAAIRATETAGKYGVGLKQSDHTHRAPWSADAPAVETERTVFTRCPSHPPRFQERVFSFVHGGLRAA